MDVPTTFELLYETGDLLCKIAHRPAVEEGLFTDECLVLLLPEVVHMVPEHQQLRISVLNSQIEGLDLIFELLQL